MADVYVAAPDPFARSIRTQLKERSRLRIVNKDDICSLKFLAQALGILGIGLLIDTEQQFGDVDCIPLEGIMHTLRTQKELIAAAYDLPRGIYPQLLHERHQFFQDLRHTAAFLSRIDMNDPFPL
jgi:hypothetical protein